jgi:hypothetical protein
VLARAVDRRGTRGVPGGAREWNYGIAMATSVIDLAVVQRARVDTRRKLADRTRDVICSCRSHGGPEQRTQREDGVCRNHPA